LARDGGDAPLVGLPPAGAARQGPDVPRLSDRDRKSGIPAALRLVGAQGWGQPREGSATPS